MSKLPKSVIGQTYDLLRKARKISYSSISSPVPMYKAPNLDLWQGRTDASEAPTRWHQVVRPLDLSTNQPASPGTPAPIAFLGFRSDEGVRRNGGRPGAAGGPVALRKAMGNLALPAEGLALADAGDVACGADLEQTQAELAERVAQLLAAGYRPLLLGGGHEIAYAHYTGLRQGSDRPPAILNLDAHFDLRPQQAGQASSGTPFRQIAEELRAAGQPFAYLALGIDEAANDTGLFATARELGADFMLAEECEANEGSRLFTQLAAWLAKQPAIYLTLDLDVLRAADAPGVSAPALCGLSPWVIRAILRQVAASGKLLSADVAELNPAYDPDNRTARLAARLVYELVTHWR